MRGSSVIRLGEAREPRWRSTYDHLLAHGGAGAGAAFTVEVAEGRKGTTPFWLKIQGLKGGCGWKAERRAGCRRAASIFGEHRTSRLGRGRAGIAAGRRRQRGRRLRAAPRRHWARFSHAAGFGGALELTRRRERPRIAPSGVPQCRARQLRLAPQLVTQVRAEAGRSRRLRLSPSSLGRGQPTRRSRSGGSAARCAKQPREPASYPSDSFR